jgi:hypothetical protein
LAGVGEDWKTGSKFEDKNYNLPAVRREYPAAGGKKTVLVIAYIPYTHREIRQISVKIPTPGSKYDFFE